MLKCTYWFLLFPVSCSINWAVSASIFPFLSIFLLWWLAKEELCLCSERFTALCLSTDLHYDRSGDALRARHSLCHTCPQQELMSLCPMKYPAESHAQFVFTVEVILPQHSRVKKISCLSWYIYTLWPVLLLLFLHAILTTDPLFEGCLVHQCPAVWMLADRLGGSSAGTTPFRSRLKCLTSCLVEYCVTLYRCSWTMGPWDSQ